MEICSIHNIEMTLIRATWWEDAIKGRWGEGFINSEGVRITHLWICKECRKGMQGQEAK